MGAHDSVPSLHTNQRNMKFLLLASLMILGTIALPQSGEDDIVPEVDVAIEDAKALENHHPVKAGEGEVLASASDGDEVYKTCTLTFEASNRGKRFKNYMYRNIYPLAAANMKECIRCKGPGGTCVEYMKFSNQASFQKYSTYSWVPKKAMTEFMNSGTKNSGMSDTTKAAFEAATKDKNCERVTPAGSPRQSTKKSSSSAVYKTTTITFGHPSFKQYMYKNICPLAAGEMEECYRCPNAAGQCVEFQKFSSTASFDKFKAYGWLPKHMLMAFFSSGSSTNGYSTISEGAFNSGIKGKGCEKVAAADGKAFLQE